MTLLLLSAALQASDHPWARHKAGTSVTYLTVMEFGGTSMKSSESWTLKEVTADHIVMTVVGDQTPETQHKIPLSNPATSDLGSEGFGVEGKRFRCTIKQVVQGDTTVTSWVCPEAPGGFVRSVTKAPQAETTTTLVKLSDPQKIGATSVDCWVLETVAKNAAGETRFRLWNSSAVPGLQVRYTLDGPGTRVERTVTAYDIK